MRKRTYRLRVIVSLGIVSLLGGSLRADDAPEFPKPGPEQALLKIREGTWQTEMKMNAMGNQPAMESKGTMTAKMECGGLWLCTNFASEFGGMKFQGKSFDGYDPAKKKFVSVWIDSMGSSPEFMEGTYDKKTKTFTMTGEYKNSEGKIEKHKMVSAVKDEDTIHSTFYTVGKDGKETAMMTVAYKRKK